MNVLPSLIPQAGSLPFRRPSSRKTARALRALCAFTLLTLSSRAQDTRPVEKADDSLLRTAESAAALDEAAARWIPNTGRPLEDLLTARTTLLQELNAAQEAVKGMGHAARLNATIEWHRRNATRVEAVSRRTGQYAATLLQPAPAPIHEVQIPVDASPELEELLVERARMHNENIRIQQRLAAEPEKRDEILAQWQGGIAEASGRQDALARSATAKAPQWVPPVPLQPLIPLDASPELADFLTARHALLRERAEAAKAAIQRNPAAGGDPAAGEEALARWDAQNRARLESLAEKAARLPER